MDVSVVAAVGSFAISERVLKPKATLLSILGCVLIYDLTTKTHDVASLRVYRGPALLAFTLMMTAYSLRTWRRNGVACDELLFLPGTPHGDSHGIESPEPVMRAEGDVAAGVPYNGNNTNNNIGTIHESPAVEMASTSSSPALRANRTRSLSGDSSLSSIHEFANSWDDNEADADSDDVLREPLTTTSPHEQGNSNNNTNFHRSNTDRSMHAIRSGGGPSSGPVERFRENHPRITRIGSFFFFRSSSTSTQSATYAPSGPSVVGAALDLTMPIMFNFHLFIEAFNHYDVHGGSETPAKILPMIFLSVLLVRTTIPPGRRGRFWGTMKFTMMAPFHQSLFRDSFLGDVFTSLVRPFQDVAFALAYYVTVVYGTLTSKYGLSDSGRILQSSRILHNVVLPSCALLPLWWRFLQTLRESYDSGNRWPHLGNAFKYLSAALVILYGMTHDEEERRTFWWISIFVIVLLYQIWWDTIMDWELFVIVPKQEPSDVENHCFTRISSVRPQNYLLLALQRNLIQPIRDMIWFALSRIPSWKQIQLRPRRLYKSEAFYWRIFLYNVVCRAAWMLCYIPSYRIDDRNFSSDVHNYMGVLLPVIEILRRTYWGFLLLEVKTIHMTDVDQSYSQVETEDVESTISHSKHGGRRNLPSWLGNQQQLQQDAANLSSHCGSLCSYLPQISDDLQEKLFIAELALWAVAFIGVGLWATT